MMLQGKARQKGKARQSVGSLLRAPQARPDARSERSIRGEVSTARRLMLGHNRLSHGGKWRCGYPAGGQTIAFPRLNSITHICRKHNITLFFSGAGHRRREAV